MQTRPALATVVVLLAAVALLAPAALAPAVSAAPRTALSPGPAPSPTPPHIVVSHVTLKGPRRSVWLGDTVPLVVSAAPMLSGAPLVLESRHAGGWSQEATATLGPASQARLFWFPQTCGPARLRVSLPAGDGHTAAVSSALRLTVNRPNRHHVLYKYAHYIVIVVHEFRLYYYEHGAVVRAFDVALGRPGYRTPLGTFHIYGKRKPAGGALGSCAMFYRRAGGIAIHGTDQPGLLRRFPRPFSHGCARMYNSQALWLYAQVPRGTTVHNLK
jgi:lipoprotein-anchoring transpeptidase ErfK/SrfK